MKRTLRLGYLVAVTALAGCGRGTPSAAADTTAAAAPVATVAPPAGGELASSRTFNSLLGNFQFAVPDVWEQRYTATERGTAPEFPGAKSVSEFMFLPIGSNATSPADDHPIRRARVEVDQGVWKGTGTGGCGRGRTRIRRAVPAAQSLPCGQRGRCRDRTDAPHAGAGEQGDEDRVGPEDMRKNRRPRRCRGLIVSSRHHVLNRQSLDRRERTAAGPPARRSPAPRSAGADRWRGRCFRRARSAGRASPWRRCPR